MSKIVLTDEASTPSTPAAGTTVIYTQGGAFYVLSPLGTPSAPITSSLLTATGDLIYASAPGTAARRAIGTSGQFLSVAGGLPVWTTLFTATTPAALGGAPAAGSSSEAARRDHVHQLPVSAAGDLMYANGATTVTNLAIGTVGQVLAVNAGATAPVWQSPPTFVAGPTSSTAQFRTATAIQDAITAAAAAISGGLPSAVVEILPGAYTATLTVPANVSLTAPGGLGSVLITGNITVSSASGRNAISGLYVIGTLACDAGGASTAIVEVDTCQFVAPLTAVTATVSTANSGWVLNVSQCIVDSSAVAGLASLGFTAGTKAKVKSTEFITELTSDSVVGSADMTFDGCKFNRGFSVSGVASQVTIQNCVFDLIASPTEVFYLDGGAAHTLNILGSFGLNGLAAAGALYTLNGLTTVTANVSPGTALGSYQLANLPALSAGSDGALAYVSDQNSLYVRRSAAWSRVALPANANTWTGTQTFNETVFNRAANATAVNTGTATYTMASNTVAPLIRMDTASGGGAKTVTLFTPDAGGADNGKQWVIFDALRNAGSGPEPIDIAVPGGVTINGGAGPYASAISTDGGAIVVRVTGATAWETIGL